VRFASLFAGSGGFDLGLERAGHECALQVELDDYRYGILSRHWPDVPKVRDVRDVRAGQPLPRGAVDLVCGGFPCRDLSVVGRRRGLEHEDSEDGSGLFFELARVADDLLRPGAWLLIENVPGMLSSSGGRDLAVLLRTLGDLGFHDLAWRVLDSRLHGVPQSRRRVFVLARRASGSAARRVLLDDAFGAGDPPAGHGAWPKPAASDRGGAPGDSGARVVEGFDSYNQKTTHQTAKTLRGLRWNDRQGSIDAIPLLVEYEAFDAYHQESTGGTVRTLRANGKGGGRTDAIPHLVEYEPVENAIADGRVTRALTARLGTSGWDGTDAEGNLFVAETEEEGEDVVAVAENQRGEVLEAPDDARTLAVGDGKPGQRYPLVRVGTRVRRLTPTECERLQGFPDGWTLPTGPSLARAPSWYQQAPEDRDQTPRNPRPHARRYEAMGRAVTVPVAEAIGRRLYAWELAGED
jgi:DNA (cytosine-5)-methyltransferase 1